MIRLCRRSSILDYYFNLRGNNSSAYLNSLTEKMRIDDRSMTTYYRNLITPDKSCIYSSFVNDHFRQIITRWTLSNHKVRIETGRYSRPTIPRENRVCEMCNTLENESHVIFDCPAYHTVRQKYHNLLSIRNNIVAILNPCTELIVETARLLYDFEQVREDLGLQ